MGAAALPIATTAASAVAGNQQAKKVKTNEKNRKKELLGLQGGMLDIANESYADQLGYLKKAGKASEQGYQSAIKDADRIEGQGNRDAQRLFAQGLGTANGNAASRGLLGSSVNQNMRLGAARQASYAMSDAQIAASRLRTGAQLGLGQARAGSLQNLAGLTAYRAGMKTNALLPYMNFLSNVQYTSTPPQSGNVAGLVQSFGSQYKQPGTV